MITGATGYLGLALGEQLLDRGHRVVAFVRPGGARRAPAGATVVEGNALEADDVARAVQPGDTLVHLVGTPRPSPAKGAEFRAVDLPSIAASAGAAARVGIAHLVYVSVAHPAPVMRDYIAVRVQGETLVEQAGVPATILRPWYVLGPGHWWPYALLPLYGVLALLPSTRPAAASPGPGPPPANGRRARPRRRDTARQRRARDGRARDPAGRTLKAT